MSLSSLSEVSKKCHPTKNDLTPFQEVDAMMATDERKRKYNSMAAVVEPTEAELEAWKRKRVNTADPMAFMLNK